MLKNEIILREWYLVSYEYEFSKYRKTLFSVYFVTELIAEVIMNKCFS